MRKQPGLMSLMALILASCQSTQTLPLPKSSPEASNTEPAKTTFIYNPEDREQFVFNELSPSLQKFGYDDFSIKMESFSGYRLPYDKYVGKRGYFESTEAHTDSFGYDFYPVVLETGEHLFFAVSKKGGKYGALSPIIPYELFLELKAFKPEPLVPGSNLALLSVKQELGRKTFTLSNGRKLPAENLRCIRDLSTRFGGKPELAELLSDVSVGKDEVENRYFVGAAGSGLRSEAKLYVGVNASEVWLRFKVLYYGDDWLFVKSFKVAADDYRWQSPELEFERDHSDASVWEWADISATEKEIEVARALANARNATIRFQGSQYIRDIKLEDNQKESLKTILKIFSLMNGGN